MEELLSNSVVQEATFLLVSNAQLITLFCLHMDFFWWGVVQSETEWQSDKGFFLFYNNPCSFSGDGQWIYTLELVHVVFTNNFNLKCLFVVVKKLFFFLKHFLSFHRYFFSFFSCQPRIKSEKVKGHSEKEQKVKWLKNWCRFGTCLRQSILARLVSKIKKSIG